MNECANSPCRLGSGCFLTMIEYKTDPGYSMKAKCTNSVGSFECTCPFGSIGDGFNCLDSGNCGCTEHEKCVFQDRKISCECLEGYSLDNSAGVENIWLPSFGCSL